MSNTKTEKYENISSRDYVPRYLKISRAETMSRLMGREHPAPKPFMDASNVITTQVEKNVENFLSVK